MQYFDSAVLSFPTDQITIGQMRRIEPAEFTLEALHQNIGVVLDALSLRVWELVIAEKAYARAAGLPDPHPNDDREYVIAELIDEGYRAYGLSHGIHHTRQLVQFFEEAAARQAGPTRGTGV